MRQLQSTRIRMTRCRISCKRYASWESSATNNNGAALHPNRVTPRNLYCLKWIFTDNWTRLVNDIKTSGEVTSEHELKGVIQVHTNILLQYSLEQQQVWTINDLSNKTKFEEDTKAGGWIGSNKKLNENSKDADEIGRLALEYTNKFREAHKLPPLKWHQTLANIGLVHSKGTLYLHNWWDCD